MRTAQGLVLAGALLWGGWAEAQGRRLVIAAGTPEDQALQELGQVTDAAQRLAQLNAFVERFADNPDAVAFGHWQLAQHYEAAGELERALAHGDKALEAAPGNLDILVAQAGLAQQVNDGTRLFSYAERGGAAFHGIVGDASAEQTEERAQEQEGWRPGYEFLEAAAFNVMIAEQNAKTRMGLIERYVTAFPGSRFEEQTAQYAIYTLQQLNDPKRMVAYGERALAANPESLPTLVMLASALSEQESPANLNRAAEYARRAIELAQGEADDADEARRAAAGMAYSALGYVLLRQERNPQAAQELQKAVPLLKGDAAAYSTVLYRLGYALAQVNRLTQARSVLMEAVQIEGPFQQESRELLNRVNRARAGKD